MPNLKIYGTTLNEGVIDDFFPGNKDFDYFWFQPTQDTPGGDYYLKVYAIDMRGNLMKEVDPEKDSSVTNVNIDTFIPTGVSIGTTDQLGNLKISTDQKIKSIKLQPKDYKKNYVGYNVKIKIDKPLVDGEDEEVNPSPPATRAENTWPN
jgi:hypothetical protein